MDIFTWRDKFKDKEQWEEIQMGVGKALRAQKEGRGCRTESAVPALREPATSAPVEAHT